MKIVLVAINAKYIHTNLAVRYLKAYAADYAQQITIKEFTINQYTEEILQAIYLEKPDFIGFSCYIWNISIVEELCIELKKLLPKVKIFLGGPEVSFDAKLRLENTKVMDGIMIGEGEETFLELLDYYILRNRELSSIKGIAYRQSALFPNEEESITREKAKEISGGDKEEVILTLPRFELDLSKIPFPYGEMEEFQNKIIYYETSRGCPYSCSYCLSSVDKKVRLRDLELVKKELIFFIEHRIPQVKFVDRTFNCNKKHALAIWQFIKEKDKGITNFHFEIAADILGQEEIELLNSMRVGLVQLEIGVQSTNEATVEAIRRKMDFGKLSAVVEQIQRKANIHAHLDLIAGLPFEDFTSFQKSFCDVYKLKPEQLQLGFLKVLKGSAMYKDSEKFGIVYKSRAPYEVLFTRWLSYDEVLTLKAVEDMVETYYNSGQFYYSLGYMEHFFNNPFDLYLSLARFYEKNKLFGIKHTRIRRYEILIDFMKDRKRMVSEAVSQGMVKGPAKEMSRETLCINLQAFYNLLVHDLYLRENMKSRPSFAEAYEEYKELYRNFYKDEKSLATYIGKEGYSVTPAQLKPYLHVEHFWVDVEKTAKTGSVAIKEQFILYDYMYKNPLNLQAKTTKIEL